MSTKSVVVEEVDYGDLKVSPDTADLKLPEGLVIHGYGGNKEELLGLAYHLADALRVSLRLFDLPGHGPDGDDLLTSQSAASAVQKRLKAMTRPSFFVGHSLGARLGLTTGLPTGVSISLPGPALFEGGRRDLLKTLRARRVRESKPFAGLVEILSDPLTPAAETLLLYAANDIKSATDMVREWQSTVARVEKIPQTGHLDIVSHPKTWRTISDWLGARIEEDPDAAR